MPSVHQFVFTGDGPAYKYGFDGAIPEVEIADAPDDADCCRFAMAHGEGQYRLFLMKEHTRDTMYCFGYDGESGTYVFGHGVEHPEIRLVDFPDDLDASNFDVLHDGATWRFYFPRLGGPEKQLYQFVPESDLLKFGGGDAIPTIDILGFPSDADVRRFAMYHDGHNYVFVCAMFGNDKTMYSGAFNGEAYAFGYASLRELLVDDAPEDLKCNFPSMLHDGPKYRMYFIKA